MWENGDHRVLPQRYNLAQLPEIQYQQQSLLSLASYNSQYTIFLLHNAVWPIVSGVMKSFINYISY